MRGDAGRPPRPRSRSASIARRRRSARRPRRPRPAHARRRHSPSGLRGAARRARPRADRARRLPRRSDPLAQRADRRHVDALPLGRRAAAWPVSSHQPRRIAGHGEIALQHEAIARRDLAAATDACPKPCGGPRSSRAPQASRRASAVQIEPLQQLGSERVERRDGERRALGRGRAA